MLRGVSCDVYACLSVLIVIMCCNCTGPLQVQLQTVPKTHIRRFYYSTDSTDRTPNTQSTHNDTKQTDRERVCTTPTHPRPQLLLLSYSISSCLNPFIPLLHHHTTPRHPLHVSSFLLPLSNQPSINQGGRGRPGVCLATTTMLPPTHPQLSKKAENKTRQATSSFLFQPKLACLVL